LLPSFIFYCIYKYLGIPQQEIALVADAILQMYYKTIPIDEKTFEGTKHAMGVGAKEKNVKLYVKMIKLLIVVNLVHRFGFLFYRVHDLSSF